MICKEIGWQHCKTYTSQHENFDPQNNFLPETIDKWYTTQPKYTDLGMAFVLYPEYKAIPNF